MSEATTAAWVAMVIALQLLINLEVLKNGRPKVLNLLSHGNEKYMLRLASDSTTKSLKSPKKFQKRHPFIPPRCFVVGYELHHYKITGSIVLIIDVGYDDYWNSLRLMVK